VCSRCFALWFALGERSRADPKSRDIGLAIREDGRKRGLRGYDAGKKTKGRKRQIIVDSLGLIHVLVVEPADVQDRTGGKTALSKLAESPRLKLVLADDGYSGQPMKDLARSLGFEIEFVASLKGSGFTLQKRRWIVERTFAWLLKFRRLRTDYDLLCESTASWIYAAMIRLMLRRLVTT
jgi:putative transposase